MIKALLAAAVAAGLAVICGCGQSAPASPSTATSGTAARLPGLSQDCLTMRLPPPAHHCYTPRAFDTAYGIQPLLDRGIDGRGVTVVLPEAAATTLQPPQVTDIRQDLADFDSRFGLPPARIQVITTLAGASASPWLAGAEEVQDTEIVHAVAPDATLRELLVDPADLSTPAKAAATFATYVRIAARDGEVISQGGFGLDYNLGENGFTSAEAATVNSALEYAAARHVTYVCGSGDQGAIGQGSTPPVKEVTLPADDPLVLGVGGTSLTANPVTAAYISETAWYAPPGAKGDYSVGSGGGFSHLFARPAYQDSVPGIGAWRGVPDVAGDASLQTGVAYARSAPGGTYQLKPTGGTRLDPAGTRSPAGAPPTPRSSSPCSPAEPAAAHKTPARPRRRAAWPGRRSTTLAEAKLLPNQRPRLGGNESHNPVTGLPAPLRVLCRLTSGNLHAVPQLQLSWRLAMARLALRGLLGRSWTADVGWMLDRGNLGD